MPRAGFWRNDMANNYSQKGDARQSLITSAKVSYSWILVALYFTSFGGFLALTAWFHSYWQQYFGFSPVKAGIARTICYKPDYYLFRFDKTGKRIACLNTLFGVKAPSKSKHRKMSRRAFTSRPIY